VAYDRRKSLQGSSSCCWSKRRQSGYEPYKRGFNTKIHLAVDSFGLLVRMLITEGTRADCKEAVNLIRGIKATALPADRGYNTKEIIDYAKGRGIATRYGKNSASFLAAVHIRCIAIWLKVIA